MSLTLADCGLRVPETPAPVAGHTWMKINHFRGVVQDDFTGLGAVLDDGLMVEDLWGKGCSTKFIGKKIMGKTAAGDTIAFLPYDIDYLLVPNKMLEDSFLDAHIEDEREMMNEKK